MEVILHYLNISNSTEVFSYGRICFDCLLRDKVVDFHWNSSDPWTIISVSDDGESTGGGGTLQVTYPSC